MATSLSTSGSLTYSDLMTKYNSFEVPTVVLLLKNKDFANNDHGFIVSEVEVEVTSGFEASIAEMTINNVYDTESGVFMAQEISDMMEIGAAVEIALGYFDTTTTVFQGFVAGVSYRYNNGELPCAVVTAMDVKGIMMANTYSTQLKATSYGEAVREIMQKTAYTSQYDSITIEATEDKQEESNYPERTLEMVAESDYDFVVKAAKKFNYEFFVEGKTVLFRKAKSNTSALITLTPGDGLFEFQIDYSVNGLVDEVEVRAMDVGAGKAVTYSATRSGDLSLGSKAASLLKKSKKVYIDPTAQSNAMAKVRVESLMETMTYRFGDFHGTCVGLPDVVPGRFYAIDGMGAGINNNFYITKVVHSMTQDGYHTYLTGCAPSLPSSSL